MINSRIISILKRQEGLRNKVYTCPAGKLTIGIGRNLEDRGITDDEANFLLDNDVSDIHFKLAKKLEFYNDLDSVRQEVLLNMSFQMGIGGMLKFRKMIKAVKKSDYKTAAIEMLDSRWAKQTSRRAKELSKAMEGGEWEKETAIYV
jgi:lysozyme